MIFFRVIRMFFWAMMTRSGRFRMLWTIFRFCPGDYGMLIRARLLGPQLKSVGTDLTVREGVFIRNPQMISVGSHLGIGDNVFLQAGGGLEIGDHVILGPSVKIWTQNHQYADPETPIRLQGTDYGPVRIDDDVWIGTDTFIMPGTHLQRGCIVAANSVVSGRVYKEFSILAGNPARVIGFRNVARPNAGESKNGQNCQNGQNDLNGQNCQNEQNGD